MKRSKILLMAVAIALIGSIFVTTADAAPRPTRARARREGPASPIGSTD